MKLLTWALFLLTSCFPCFCEHGTNNNETAAVEFLAYYNEAAPVVMHKLVIKAWDLQLNITDLNLEEFVKQETEAAKFVKEMRTIAITFNDSAMSQNTRRQLFFIKNIGAAALPDDTTFEELSTVRAKMESIYSTAKVCLKQDKCLDFSPDIVRIMATSRDYEEMLDVWVGWHNSTGRNMKELYPRYVELNNEAARSLGFRDIGEQWRSFYESDTFVEDVRALFDQIRPLYEQLHAYTRKRLKKVYGEDKFPASGHIPAHILGNMWAQQWDELTDLLRPFENAPSVNITGEMIRQNYTVVKMFRTAEEFLVSLGFDEMVPTFWNLSLFERPADDREVTCQGAAWDFGDGKDYRINGCYEIKQQSFEIVYNQMGDIGYYMQYKDQPFIYRDPANEGFPEAIGGLMALSFQTPEHLKKINLINEISQNEEEDINFLLNSALLKVAFLPFGYLVDQWRWSVFSGEITPDQYNKEWWRLRCELQGVSPPVPRSEEDFDPGAKYHIPANAPYINYFLGFILQFQFHEALCREAKYEGPLHRCDIYNSSAAGLKLRNMLKLGSSQPWQTAIKELTGQDKIDAGPMLDYFKPLLDFLRKENGNDVGWNPSC